MTGTRTRYHIVSTLVSSEIRPSAMTSKWRRVAIRFLSDLLTQCPFKYGIAHSVPVRCASLASFLYLVEPVDRTLR